jgi:hypothetical protein
MKRLFIAILVVATCLALGAGVALAQGDVSLDLKAQGLSQRPPVEFKHESHLKALGDESCGECHHAPHGGGVSYEAGDEEKPCADCHKVEAEGKRPGLMRAFHTNCQGCHAKQRKEYKETGPVSCGACHVKQK